MSALAVIAAMPLAWALPLLLAGSQASAAPAAASDAIERFARQTLGASDFLRAEADLNADGRPETFIYVRDPDRCGTGGCNLFILSPDPRGHRVMANVTVTWPPITLLPTSTNGWRDVGVTIRGRDVATVEGRLVQPSEMARLRFDGRRYPGNPTVPPASPLGKTTGEVLIGG